MALAVVLSILFFACSSEDNETGVVGTVDQNPAEVQSEEPVEAETGDEPESESMLQRPQSVANVTSVPADGAETGSDTGDNVDSEDFVPVPLAGMESTTDRGFQKWEWWSRSVLDAYKPYRPYFDFFIVGEPARFLEYWVGHGGEEPDVNSPQQRDTEEYNAEGELVERTSYSNELGYDYTRYRYDDLGRLINVEERVSVRDVGFDKADIQPSQSFWIQYVEESELDADVSRVVTSYDGERTWIEGERRIDGGWDYVGGRRSSSDHYLRVLSEHERLSVVETRSRMGTIRLSFAYDEFGRLVQTMETHFDGVSTFKSVEYRYDWTGRLILSRTWEHNSENEGRVREFSDHDNHGNWRRRVTTLDGEIESIVVRRIAYW